MNTHERIINIERCIFFKYFYIYWKKLIGIDFNFWSLTSRCITERIHEKKSSIAKITEFSRKFLTKKEFNLRNIVKLEFKIQSNVLKINNHNLNQFLRFCGPVFFTKFENNLKIILWKMFGLNLYIKFKKSKNSLSNFIYNHFNNIFHFFIQNFFLKLTCVSLMVSDIWLLSKLPKNYNFPWWRFARIRECELEYNCKGIINGICGNLDKGYN